MDRLPYKAYSDLDGKVIDDHLRGKLVAGNMLFVPKAGISQGALNQLKRLAAFKNPEFYKNQAMRMSTYGKPRIICCAEDTVEHLCLPRGCEQDLRTVFSGQGMDVNCLDQTNRGKKKKQLLRRPINLRESFFI